MNEFIVFLIICMFGALVTFSAGSEYIPFFAFCMLAMLAIFTTGQDTQIPTREELARATEQCYGQRIGDPAFRFPYNISCAEWVKIKVGDNKYTQQYIDDHIKTEKLAEEEWGN